MESEMWMLRFEIQLLFEIEDFSDFMILVVY